MPMPSKFTEVRRREAIEARTVGASMRTCAQVIGVSHEALRGWLAKGEKATEGPYHEFYVAWQKATASPKLRALGIIWRAMPDKPDLAWKFIERQEAGFAPPAAQAPAAVAGPTIVNLTLGGAPVPRWADSEVIDAQEVPALGDGGGDAAAPTPT